MGGLEDFSKGLKQLQKDLKKLSSENVGITVEADKEGYFDRECPKKECMTKFKVYSDDWVEKFKDDKVYCPYCKEDAPADHFFSSEHIDKATNEARKLVRKTITRALNNKKNYFKKIPIQAHEILNNKYQCGFCNARYSIVGTAFFCPCCGKNSVRENFSDSLKKIEDSLNSIPQIKTIITDKDVLRNCIETIIESALENCVGVFEVYCKDVFVNSGGVLGKKNRKTIFQNLPDGSKLWYELIEFRYEDCLSNKEYDRLNIFFNRRHLLIHNQGKVDDKYLRGTNDNTYNEGQRIVVKEKEVRTMIRSISKLVNRIENRVNNIENK